LKHIFFFRILRWSPLTMLIYVEFQQSLCSAAHGSSEHENPVEDPRAFLLNNFYPELRALWGNCCVFGVIQSLYEVPKVKLGEESWYGSSAVFNIKLGGFIRDHRKTHLNAIRMGTPALLCISMTFGLQSCHWERVDLERVKRDQMAAQQIVTFDSLSPVVH